MKTRARKHPRNQGPETRIILTSGNPEETVALHYEGHVKPDQVPGATLKKYGRDKADVVVAWFVDGQEVAR